MFQHQGPGRSERQNRVLAGYLAFWGGFVNSSGFVLIGSFTSHVTGNVGRFANDIATRRLDAAAAALTMVIAFFIGSFVASMAVESDIFGRSAHAYGVALLGEALLLLVFTGIARLTREAHPRLHDMEAAILCAAMGMQNSLVTRLSGAVVRTTHLTGVFTDLGIEGARWFRYWRSTLAQTIHLRLAFGHNPSERPSLPKVLLLATISVAFTLGAVGGAGLALTFQHAAMLVAAFAIFSCAFYAFWTGHRPNVSTPSPPASRK